MDPRGATKIVGRTQKSSDGQNEFQKFRKEFDC
eukprot:SAG31_NODE_7153_length_1772_cov_1.913329_1_plen_32_part_10